MNSRVLIPLAILGMIFTIMPFELWGAGALTLKGSRQKLAAAIALLTWINVHGDHDRQSELVRFY